MRGECGRTWDAAKRIDHSLLLSSVALQHTVGNRLYVGLFLLILHFLFIGWNFILFVQFCFVYLLRTKQNILYDIFYAVNCYERFDFTSVDFFFEWLKLYSEFTDHKVMFVGTERKVTT